MKNSLREGHLKNKKRQDLTAKTSRKEVSKESARRPQRAKAESAASREASQASKARPKKITRRESAWGIPFRPEEVSVWDGKRLVRVNVRAMLSALARQNPSKPT